MNITKLEQYVSDFDAIAKQYGRTLRVRPSGKSVRIEFTVTDISPIQGIISNLYGLRMNVYGGNPDSIAVSGYITAKEVEITFWDCVELTYDIHIEDEVRLFCEDFNKKHGLDLKK